MYWRSVHGCYCGACPTQTDHIFKNVNKASYYNYTNFIWFWKSWLNTYNICFMSQISYSWHLYQQYVYVIMHMLHQHISSSRFSLHSDHDVHDVHMHFVAYTWFATEINCLATHANTSQVWQQALQLLLSHQKVSRQTVAQLQPMEYWSGYRSSRTHTRMCISCAQTHTTPGKSYFALHPILMFPLWLVMGILS